MQFTLKPRRVGSVVFALGAFVAAMSSAASGIDQTPPAEPKATQALTTFRLRYPNYRGWLFPQHPSAEVEVEGVKAEGGHGPQDLDFRLELTGAGQTVWVETSLKRGAGRLSVSAKGLRPGDVLLKASVRRGSRELGAQTWSLRLLTSEDVSALKAYVDADDRLIVDGKPFFPLGWYGAVNESQLAEIADSPFNCLLAYGTDLVPKERMRRFLDTMQASGLKLIYCLNDVYPTATYLQGKGWEGIQGNANIAAAVVRAYRDHPAVVAWYLNDELPHKLAAQLEDYYHSVRRGDPSRPCFIVLCNCSEFSYFPQTTDILGVDPYPIPKEPVTQVSDYVDAARKATGDTEPVWLVPQAFAWYQYNSKNPDRGHIPSEEELQKGRAPTREEERCMTYLGLIHGAKGLIYYCYYDLRVLPQYTRMWAWMKSIAAEVKSLSPALLSSQDPGGWRLATRGAPIQAKLFRRRHELYLLAANPANTACRARFDVRRRTASQVEVMFENREVSADRGEFEDGFSPLAVHVYRLTLAEAPGAAPQ